MITEAVELPILHGSTFDCNPVYLKGRGRDNLDAGATREERD